MNQVKGLRSNHIIKLISEGKTKAEAKKLTRKKYPAIDKSKENYIEQLERFKG